MAGSDTTSGVSHRTSITSINPETQIRLTCFSGTFNIEPGVESNAGHTLTGWLRVHILGDSSRVKVKIPSAVQVFNPQTPHATMPSIHPGSLSTHKAFPAAIVRITSRTFPSPVFCRPSSWPSAL